MNILLILTDDQPFHTLYRMTRTRRLVEEGVDYLGYSIIPWCGPARVSLFSGLCAHNHGCFTNKDPWAYSVYRNQGWPQKDLIKRIKASGYRTGYFGKLINGYGQDGLNGSWVHPYADRWVALVGGQNKPPYHVNIDGTVREETKNHTPFFGEKAENFIRSGVDRQPWFAWLNWTDPHTPYTPMNAYDHTHDDERYASPGTAETNLSDKSAWSRQQLTASQDAQQRTYEGTMEELEGVDLWIGKLLDALDETGQDTVVIFTSDNGYMMGEHGGMTSKNLPYEESSRVPFVIRGIGAEARLASHLDIPATILDIAGGDMSGVDGRSLLSSEAQWRKRLLVEHPGLGWYMLREGNYAYFELPTGESELYDLSVDPYETEAIEDDVLKEQMSGYLRRLRVASGDEFRAIEEE